MPLCSSGAFKSEGERFGLTASQVLKLGELAVRAQDRAHCPFSRFRVGAALLTQSGKYITGCNVENASFPVSICAERTAMAKAVSEGETKFVAIAVATDVLPPTSPCGMCRQFMREFCQPDLPVFMYGPSEGPSKQPYHYEILTMEQLLPMSFGPESMNPVRANLEQARTKAT